MSDVGWMIYDLHLEGVWGYLEGKCVMYIRRSGKGACPGVASGLCWAWKLCIYRWT